MEQKKEAVAEMPEVQQDQLAAFLIHLRHLRHPQFRQELARKLDDRDPSHSVSLDELRERWKDE